MSSETALVPQDKAPVAIGPRGVEIHTFEDLWRMAKVAHASGLMPKGINSPEAACMIIQAGMELGLTPWQALQGMQSINGKVGIGGDLALAIVRNSPLMESYRESFEGEGETLKHIIVSRRKGESEPYESTFSADDARRAQLWGKSGVWSQYPKRMLRYRNLGFHLRDFYPEPLKGFKTAEELADYSTPERNVTPIHIVSEIVAEPPAERPNKNAVTDEQLRTIADLAWHRGVVPDDVSREMFGMPVMEISSGSAQRLVGHLKTLPIVSVGPGSPAADEPVEPEAAPTPEPASEPTTGDTQPFDEAPPPVTDAMAAEITERREAEGRVLASAGRVTRDEKARCYYVKSDKGTRYKVSQKDGKPHCSCKAFQFEPDVTCKHLIAVRHFAKGPLPLVLISEARQADLLSALDERGLDPTETLLKYGVESGRVANCSEEVFDKILADLF